MTPTITTGINQRNIDLSDIEQIVQNSSTSTEVLGYTFLVDEDNFDMLAKHYNLSIIPQMDDSELLLKFPQVEIKIKRKCTTKKK